MIRMIVISWDDVMMMQGDLVEEDWFCVVAWNVLSSSVGRNRNIHVNSEICTSPFLTYRDLKTCRLPWKWIRLPPKQQAQNKTNQDLKSRRYSLSYKGLWRTWLTCE
jgi:hypothetical protein